MIDRIIILAGGAGTRLRSAVPDLPKVLAPVAGRPFLEWLIQGLARQGATHFALSLGYRAEAVLDYLADAKDLPAGLVIDPVVEPDPLGTGGAVQHVARVLGLYGRAVVVNGDTYLSEGLRDLAGADAERDNVVGLVRVAEVARYGRVETDLSGRVTAFLEKQHSGPGWVNAGICRLDLDTVSRCSNSCFSLESSVLPKLAARGALYAQPLPSRFIDIGIPEDYDRFCAWAAAGLEA